MIAEEVLYRLQPTALLRRLNKEASAFRPFPSIRLVILPVLFLSADLFAISPVMVVWTRGAQGILDADNRQVDHKGHP